MLTMLLGGLWHGASWNFVIWGGYHGALLSAERALGPRSRGAPHPLLYPFRALLTFALVCAGWVFFRAVTMSDSLFVLHEMFLGSPRGNPRMIPPWLFVTVGVSLVIALLEEKLEWVERLPRGPAWAYVAAVVLLLLSVELIGVTERAVPFVYFQF
jgi:D-alanyl-lipoteichoic acid acyltransferase DltB (MBOAT superfamily)